MVSMLALSAVDRGFKPWSGWKKDYEIGICGFFAKRAALNIHITSVDYKDKEQRLVGLKTG